MAVICWRPSVPILVIIAVLSTVRLAHSTPLKPANPERPDDHYSHDTLKEMQCYALPYVSCAAITIAKIDRLIRSVPVDMAVSASHPMY
jgi:hypothetical protein